jgi:hypothetical protein
MEKMFFDIMRVVHQPRHRASKERVLKVCESLWDTFASAGMTRDEARLALVNALLVLLTCYSEGREDAASTVAMIEALFELDSPGEEGEDAQPVAPPKVSIEDVLARVLAAGRSDGDSATKCSKAGCRKERESSSLWCHEHLSSGANTTCDNLPAVKDGPETKEG